MGLGGHVVTGCTMSTHDETQNTNTTEMSAGDDRTMTWMDTNGRGQIVRRPRRFRGLTQREGFADYVEQAYRAATKLGMLEALAALPSLEDKTVTEIAGLTRTLVWRIRQRMRTFHDGYGPNIYYGALTRMVEAAKEDVRPTAQKEDTGAAAAAETNTFVPTSLPPLPTSPLIRQSGGAVETVSDSEVELGRAAVRDVLTSRMASAVTGWTDLSGHPFVGRPGVTGGGGPFIRTVSGVGDAVEEEPPRLPAAREDEERDSDEDSASVEGEEETDTAEVTGAEEEDSDEETGGEDEDDGQEADTEGGDDTEPEDEEGDGEQIQHVPAPAAPAPAAPLHQNIGIELPMWAWLAILVAFAAWAALVNGVLSRDLGCRLSR